MLFSIHCVCETITSNIIDFYLNEKIIFQKFLPTLETSTHLAHIRNIAFLTKWYPQDYPRFNARSRIYWGTKSETTSEPRILTFRVNGEWQLFLKNSGGHPLGGQLLCYENSAFHVTSLRKIIDVITRNSQGNYLLSSQDSKFLHRTFSYILYHFLSFNRMSIGHTYIL